MLEVIRLSPNSITPTFTETSPRGKSWTQIMKVADTNGDKSWNHEVSVKVADTNHENRGHIPSRHVEMFATKSATKSADYVADTNHESRRRNLCPRHGHDFVGNLSRTLSQSRRNGIWALPAHLFVCVGQLHKCLEERVIRPIICHLQVIHKNNSSEPFTSPK